jgi:hypothetical protein
MNMNMKKSLYIFLIAFFILFGCSVETIEKKEFQAEEEFTEVFNMVVHASYTGDASDLMAYMENEEGGQKLKELLEKDGVTPEDHTDKCLGGWGGPGLPSFCSGEFRDGDILLLRDYSQFASNLLDWLIPSVYTHTGVLDLNGAYCPNDPCQGCVMSASITDEKGLIYQTYRDWAQATTVTRMRVEDHPEYVAAELEDAKKTFFEYWHQEYGTTTYAFIYPEIVIGPSGPMYVLQPVPNLPGPDPFDPDPIHPGTKYWHCSKTAWFIYYLMGYTDGKYGFSDVPDIENNDWYLRKGDGYLRTFGFYKLYKVLLEMQGYDSSTASAIALLSLKNAIELVVIPDEIRYATTDPTAGEAGPLNGEKWSFNNPDGVKTWGIPEIFISR